MSLLSHLPALQVVIPLMAAPLTVLARRRTPAFLIALVSTWSALIISLQLLAQVKGGKVLSYAIGNWAPPWGIEYRVDGLNAFVLVLVCSIAAIILPYSRKSIEAEIDPSQHYLFYTMFMLCLAGLLGITITGDAFNIFVFLEVSSLSTYVLIAMGKDRRALVASYQYLIMGTIGATFIVIGIGLLYLMTGTLNLADMGARLANIKGTRPVLAALAFLTVGLSLKLALFPLHQWLPNAYSYGPSAVVAFLSATATKVAVYVLLRFYASVFGFGQVFDQLPMTEILLTLALAGMFAASAIAIFQSDLKRLFAFSSIGQIGYIILGISFASTNGLTASVIHLFNHGITKAAIFMLLGLVVMVVGGTSLNQVRGLGKRMPWTSFGILICGLSLIGVPGTAGFISKWYLILAAIEKSQWWLVFLVLASSLLAAVYVWRFVEAAYLSEPDDPKTANTPRRIEQSSQRLPLSITLPTVLIVLSTIYFGLDASWTSEAARQAADAMIGALKR